MYHIVLKEIHGQVVQVKVYEPSDKGEYTDEWTVKSRNYKKNGNLK